MRAAGIVGCHRRKHKLGTTKQNPNAAAAPDLVDRKFTATAPNQLWVADVTYVPTVQGWLYLACVTDGYSRMILGWSMASHRKTLGWKTPAEVFEEQLRSLQQAGVASTS